MAIYGPPFPNYRGGPLQRGRLSRKIKNVPYKVKPIKARQLEIEIELEDDLVIDDDDDLDFVDCEDR